MGFSSLILLVLFFPETYGPTILVNKAAEMRRKTKNWGIHAKQEEIEVDFKELIVKNVSRPFRILFTEPIVFLLTLYMSVPVPHLPLASRPLRSLPSRKTSSLTHYE